MGYVHLHRTLSAMCRYPVLTALAIFLVGFGAAAIAVLRAGQIDVLW